MPDKRRRAYKGKLAMAERERQDAMKAQQSGASEEGGHPNASPDAPSDKQDEKPDQ